MTCCVQAIPSGASFPTVWHPDRGGKTSIAPYLLWSAFNQGKRAAFVVDRVSLVDQTSKVLDAFGVEHGVVQANHWRRRPGELIQVCSAQTIEKRGFFPSLDLLVVDECRMRCASLPGVDSRRARTSACQGCPRRRSRADSGVVFQPRERVSTDDLVADGFLVPVRMYAAVAPNMSGAKVVAGEWSDKGRSRRAYKIIGDIVSEWVSKTHQHFGGRSRPSCFRRPWPMAMSYAGSSTRRVMSSTRSVTGRGRRVSAR